MILVIRPINHQHLFTTDTFTRHVNINFCTSRHSSYVLTLLYIPPSSMFSSETTHLPSFSSHLSELASKLVPPPSDSELETKFLLKRDPIEPCVSSIILIMNTLELIQILSTSSITQERLVLTMKCETSILVWLHVLSSQQIKASMVEVKN